MTLCAFRLGEPPLVTTTPDASVHTRPGLRLPSRIPVRRRRPPVRFPARAPCYADLAPGSPSPRMVRSPAPTSRNASLRLDLEAVIRRSLRSRAGTAEPRPFVLSTAPHLFDDEIRHSTALSSPPTGTAPRRGLVGRQLPNGAPVVTGRVTVGGMPLVVSCNRFDCQRAPVRCSRWLYPARRTPWSERRGLRPRQPRCTFARA
jgi:hypothetical protein